MADMSRERTDMASRVIAASPQTIYRAFLDPDALVKWLPPQGMTGHIHTFKPREGESYRMALTYGGDASMRGKTSEDTDLGGAFWNWSRTNGSFRRPNSSPTIRPLRAR